MIFAVDIMTADFSSLKMRAFAYALTSSPYIITAFGGPSAAQTINDGNWRWGYGAWTIYLPVVSLPMVYMLQKGKRAAKKNGLITKTKSARTWQESVKHHAVDFDGKSYRVCIICHKTNEMQLSACSCSLPAWYFSFFLLLLPHRPRISGPPLESSPCSSLGS